MTQIDPIRTPPIASLHDATLAMQRRANAKERFLRRISRQTSNKVAPAEGKGTDDAADGVRSFNKITQDV